MDLPDGSSICWLAGLLCALLGYRILLRTAVLTRNAVALKRPPDTLPVLGNGVRFLQTRQKLFSWFVQCERRFGYETFQISVPSLPPGVVINDPKNLAYIFKHEETFMKGDFFKQVSRDLFGRGIINVDGELWKLQRKAGLSFLHSANLRVLTDVALPRYLDQTVELLKQRGIDGGTVDLQTVFHEITSQLMGKMAYNMEMHADDAFTLAFDHASGATAERFQNPLWWVTEIFLGYRMRESLAVVKAFGNKIVRSAVEDRHRATAFGSGQDAVSELDSVSGTLVQSLLDALGNEELVADAALNYLSAGRDTVAQALTWTMMLLMQNPSATEKVRNEVRTLLEDGHASCPNTSGDTHPSTTLFSPAKLPYTMAVFYEALRLHPPIPFEMKQCQKATTLPDGTFLPQTSIVIWCTWAMNRSTLSWGLDADSFRPERWLVAGKLAAKSASEFPVFNGGARTCLGKRMAELMAAQVLATLVSNFDFMPAFSSPRASKSSLTLPMEGGLPCHVHSRSRM